MKFALFSIGLLAIISCTSSDPSIEILGEWTGTEVNLTEESGKPIAESFASQFDLHNYSTLVMHDNGTLDFYENKTGATSKADWFISGETLGVISLRDTLSYEIVELTESRLVTHIEFTYDRCGENSRDCVITVEQIYTR